MKNKYIVNTLVLLLVLTFLVSGNILGVEEELDDYELVTENRYLQFYFKEDNHDFIIRDKQSGKLWYSNPAYKDLKPRTPRDELRPQIYLNYFTQDESRKSMNNYTDSVAYDQYEIKEIENGIRIDYVLGEEWEPEDYLPVMINKERFEELILNKVSDSERDLLMDNYYLISLEKKNDSSDTEDISLPDFDTEAVFGDYSFTVDDENVSRRDVLSNLTGQFIENKQTVERRSHIKASHVDFLKDNQVYMLDVDVNAWDQEDMISIFREQGYTPEDKQEDHLENSLDPPAESVESFDIPVEYSLDKKDFIVRIPVSEIEFPMRVESEDELLSFPVYNVRVLEYFGAANKSEEGYMFVPSGSGALINLNSAKSGVSGYSETIYGQDHSFRQRKEGVKSKQNYFPVFGMKHQDKAMLGIVENGDTLGRINSDQPGGIRPYNRLYTSFNILPYEDLALPGYDTSINQYQARQYSDDIKIRFSFLEGPEADYVGMAHHYRDYLEDNFSLKKVNDRKEDLPLILELVGGISVQQPVLGIPQEVIRSLTTYSQAQEIINELNELNINNIDLVYKGLLEGGVRHNYPDSVDLEKAVGNKSDLLEFQEYLQDRDIELFPLVNFMNTYDTGFFGDFSPDDDGARSLDNRPAKKFNFDLATNLPVPGSGSYVVSPAEIGQLTDDFAADVSQFEFENIALQEMGRQINSDFRRNQEDLVDRQQSKYEIEKQFEQIFNGSEVKTTVYGGNIFTVPYVKNILEMPLRSDYDRAIDKSIPFYQIAVKGYVNYAGEPINLAEDYTENMLRTIETGAVPYYKFIYQQGENVKRTDFDYLYSANYNDWLNDVDSFYQRANQVLKNQYSQKIVDHQEVKTGVMKTTYENGNSVIVNYNETEVEVNNQQISGQDFILIGEGDKK